MQFTSARVSARTLPAALLLLLSCSRALGGPTAPGAEQRHPGRLFTWAGWFDLAARSPQVPQELRTALRLGDLPYQYFVFLLDPRRLSGPDVVDFFAGLESRGVIIVQAMPVSAFVARLDAETYAFVRDQPSVLAVEPYHAAFKLSAALPCSGAGALAAQSACDLDVLVFPGEDPEVVARLVRGLGGDAEPVGASQLRVRQPARLLAALAQIESVQAVFEHVPSRVHGEKISTIVQAGMLGMGAPFHADGIDGGGNGVPGTSPEILMLLDTGIQVDAGDLSDTRLDAGIPGLTHRKVRYYTPTIPFGGSGDLLDCDGPGPAHGHVMAAVALGNATAVPALYGAPWPSVAGLALDGVAPRALLVAYDAQVDTGGACDDPLADFLTPGDLYSAPAGGSLGEAYATRAARIFNFSWGAQVNAYGGQAVDVDDFLFQKADAMLFQSAGNDGPIPGSIGSPGTAKNAVVVGATYNAGPGLDQDDRFDASSVGPAGATGRIAPLLMAPGADVAAASVLEAFACSTGDHDQANPVACTTVSGVSGTSVAAAATSGAALLVRDYFQQGFHPDGRSTNAGNAADRVANISGALVKALLVASADWVGDGNTPGANLTLPYRFNNEQGYGRVKLTNALKLTSWSWSPQGLIVTDGGIPGGPNDLPLPGSINAVVAATQNATFQVLDDSQELRVALAWLEAPNDSLLNDLDLELVAPDLTTYFGNYFTDDNNRNGALAGGEDCPGIDGTAGGLDASPWSLPVCVNSIRDNRNPTEAILLSPDADADADNDPDFNQLLTGTWTVIVRSKAGGVNPAQRYALVVAGGVTLTGTIAWNSELFDCGDLARFKVLEIDKPTDPAGGLTPAEVSSRTIVQVLGASGVVLDEEAGFAVTQPSPGVLRFESDPLALTFDSTPTAYNGQIEIVDGVVLKAIYRDETNGVVDAFEEKQATTRITCTPTLGEAGGLRVDDYDGSTGELTIRYQPACGAPDHTIVHGPLSGVGTYTYTGQDCGIGASGSYDAFAPGPGSVFFLVVGNDGATEGSYGTNSAGVERPEDLGDPVCSLIQDVSQPCH